jgi:short-subunit dehydrogenase
MNLPGKSILLTGASSGIGYAVAKKLANNNCKIAILSRSIDKLKNFASEYSTDNNFILPVRCDVSKKEDVYTAFNIVIEKFGEIDMAILNAATSHRLEIENFSSEKVEEILSVNLTGNFYFLEKLIPYFIKKRSGMIVGISSLADTRGFPRSGIYNGSKAAFSLLLESIRIELHNYGIKVITVRPGFVKTAMTDKNEFYMPLLMKADKAADIIIRGIKKEKRSIQFPLLLAIGTKIIGLMPDSMFEYFTRKHLEGLKRKEL